MIQRTRTHSPMQVNKKPRAVTTKKTESAPQRLQKMLASAGLGSRRDMEELITSGRVTVNGQAAKIGMSVSAEDVIRVDKRPVKLQAVTQMPQILIYHKLEGEIVSQSDPEKRATVFEKLPRIKGAKWISIGRLDINTSGLMIFTSSGQLANFFMHPRHQVEREYAVRVMGQLSEAQIIQLTQGIELDDGVAAFDLLQDRGGEGSNHWYQVILREGRNREVRRMFEAMGLMVSRLMRVRYGTINLPPRLKRGQMMLLSDKEVRELLSWAELPIPSSRQNSARTREQAGKIFSPKARISPDKTEAKPKPRPAKKAGWAKAAYNPTTGQRRSDRNRNRG